MRSRSTTTIPDQRVLSVSARNVPTEYEVYYTIQYGVTGEQEPARGPQRDADARLHLRCDAWCSAKANEEEVLREAIAEDLVRIVLKQTRRKCK